MYDLFFNSGNSAPCRLDLYSWQKAVTGSCTLLAITFSDGRMCHGLIDCGIDLDSKGGTTKQNTDLHFDPKILDFIIITHAHADHIARLPILYKKGCKAKIYTSHMTDFLLETALYDAEKIMRLTCGQENQKRWYSLKDVKKVIENTIGTTFFRNLTVFENDLEKVTVKLIDNGHCLGASSIDLRITEKKLNNTIRYIFSGDYKPTSDLKMIRGIDYEKEDSASEDIPVNLVIEATYGQDGRAKKRDEDKEKNKFLKELLSGIRKNKTVFIPTLALERPISILNEIKKAQDSGELSEDIPIIVVSELLLKYLFSCEKFIDLDFMPQNVKFYKSALKKRSKTQKIRMLIDDLTLDKKHPKIVIAASGMCQFGASVSILHDYLPEKNVKILFTSYLAEGTLGQKIRDSKVGDMISVNGVMLERRAEVTDTSQFSGHASPNELIEFMKKLGTIKFVAIHHGDEIAKKDFSKRVHKEFPNVKIVTLGDGYFFRTNQWGLISSKPIPKEYVPKKRKE